MSKKPKRRKAASPIRHTTKSSFPAMAGTSSAFDMTNLLEQVQQVQAEFVKAQEALREQVVEGSAGGGMVRVSMRGDHRVTAVAIAEECVDPDDLEMLQDLIAAAVNDATAKVEELTAGIAGGSLASLGSFPGLEALDQLGIQIPAPEPGVEG